MLGFIKAAFQEKALIKGTRTRPGEKAADLFFMFCGATRKPPTVETFIQFLGNRCGLDPDEFADLVESFARDREWGWAADLISTRGICLGLADGDTKILDSRMFDLAAYIMAANGIDPDDDVLARLR